MTRSLTLALAAVCLSSLSASAHHSLAAYNRSVTKTVEGIVREFEWANPHVQMIVMVPQPDGSSKRWYFEGGGIRRLSDRGFKQEAIVLGQPVMVAYNPMRDGSPGGFFVGVKTADGKTYGQMR